MDPRAPDPRAESGTAVVSPIRVGLLAPQSGRNLGDTATFQSAIAAYRRRVPGVQLVAIVPEPASSARLLGTSGFPLDGKGEFVMAGSDADAALRSARRHRRGRIPAVRRIFEFARTLDALVFTGGGLFDDFWGGPWELPFWMLAWATAARSAGVPLSFHAVGFDRLNSRASRVMALRALRLAQYRSFRDEESRDLLRRIGFNQDSDVIPDLAFLASEPAVPEDPGASGIEPYVVVNPVSESMWSRERTRGYLAYLDTFAHLCEHLMSRGMGVRLASTQDKMDAGALEYVAGRLARDRRTSWEYRRTLLVGEFLQLAAGAELVVSSRLHGLILSMVAGTPVVAVSPMRKMTRLMSDVGMSTLNIDYDRLSGTALVEACDRALLERDDLRTRTEATVNRYRRTLSANFDDMVRRGRLGERARSRFDAPGGI